jgi:DNA polymerase-3 subunit gamma/tau
MGFAIRQLCKDLIEMFRSLLHIKVFKGSRNIPAALQEESETLAGMADQASLEELQRDMTLLLKVEKELPLTSFPLIALETALLRMCHLPPAEPLGRLLDRLEQLEKKLGGPAALDAVSDRETQAVPDSEKPAPPTEKKTDFAATWTDFLGHLSSRHPFLAAYLKRGRLLHLDQAQVQLAFPADSFEFQQLQDSVSRQILEQEGEHFFQHKLNWSLLSRGAEEFVEPPDPKLEKKQKLREETLSHPAVKAVLKIFGGEAEEVKKLESSPAEEV